MKRSLLRSVWTNFQLDDKPPKSQRTERENFCSTASLKNHNNPKPSETDQRFKCKPHTRRPTGWLYDAAEVRKLTQSCDALARPLMSSAPTASSSSFGLFLRVSSDWLRNNKISCKQVWLGDFNLGNSALEGWGEGCLTGGRCHCDVGAFNTGYGWTSECRNILSYQTLVTDMYSRKKKMAFLTSVVYECKLSFP